MYINVTDENDYKSINSRMFVVLLHQSDQFALSHIIQQWNTLHSMCWAAKDN